MKPAKHYERSTKGLRDMLFDALEQVQAGTMKPSEAVQMASVVRQIVATADLELRVQKQALELKSGDADALVLAPPVVSLGHDKDDA
ncbi:MAG: hypothetical protein AB7I42_25895 [Bradyrhizobium sp.]|uniref:hypothetical protein n=1 Tax=Bradyrhizobium sp. TaxID=376 RepID=UPI003D0990C8